MNTIMIGSDGVCWSPVVPVSSALIWSIAFGRPGALSAYSTGSANWSDSWVEFIKGCVCSSKTFKEAAAGCDAIFHLAAMVSVPECEREPARCERVNTEAVEIAADTGIAVDASVVFNSSCAVYGPNSPLPCSESATPSPISAYGLSKAKAECAIQSRIAAGGLQATCLRLFNVVGPGQRSDVPYAAVVPIFATALLEGRPLRVHGDGLQTRDFVPVDLVVEAMMRSVATPCNRAVNVATGKRTSVLELITMLSTVIGHKAECIHDEPIPEDIRHSVGDTGLFESMLGLPERWRSDETLLGTLTFVVEAIKRTAHCTPSTSAHEPNR